MANSNTYTGKVGVQLSAVMKLLGEQMYSSDVVFIRENVQNAVDATRILNQRAKLPAEKSKIHIRVTPSQVEIEDWGVGMTAEDLEQFYWNVGASSKRNQEAQDAMCIGQLGIGGFANFGVCREVHVYTCATENTQNEIHSFLRREDLQHNKDELIIQPSVELKHRGTMIRCLPLTRFDLDLILTYLEKYVEYVPELIIVNDIHMSQKPFIKDERKLSSQHKAVIRFRYGHIKGDILEYVDNTVAFLPLNINLNGREQTISGRVELNSSPLEIYKYRFLISNYEYSSKRLSGKLDLPFIKPLASREGFDSSTAPILREMHMAVADKLIEHITQKSQLLDSYRGTPLTDAIYDNERVELVENLTVTLLDSTRSTLGQLKEKSGTTQVYYLKSDVSSVARAFQGAGHIIVMTGDLDVHTRWVVIKYLTNYCGASEVPSIAPIKMVAMDDLDGNERLVLLTISKILERQGCQQISVQPCKLSPEGKIPVLLQSNSLFVDVSHPDFKNVKGYTDQRFFEGIVDHLLHDYLGDSLVRLRRRIFGPSGGGLSTILPDESYEMLLAVVEEVRLVKTRGKAWEGEDAEIILIESDDFPTMNGYYLRLHDEIAEAYKDYIVRNSKVETLWFLRTVLIFVYHGTSDALKFDVEVDKPIRVPEYLGITGQAEIKRHILIYPKGIYLPIPGELEDSFVPRGAPKKIRIRPKLEGFD